MATSGTADARTGSGLGRSLPVRLRTLDPAAYVVYLAFLLLLVFFAVTLNGQGFLSGTNLLNIVEQTTPVTVMAVATVFVLSTGEIDLSIGSVVALSSLVSAVVLEHAGLVAGVAAGLGSGIVVGLGNGLFVTLLRLPSFLVTLASMGLVAGLAQTSTNLESVAVTNLTFAGVFGSGDAGPIPSLVLWTVGAVIVGHFLLRLRRFGAHVLATGDNAASARAAGIRVERVKLAALTMSGGAAALAGMLYAGRLQGGAYTLGSSDLLLVIASVVIGGTRLFGGRGSVIGALVGSLLMGTLNNGLILSGLTPSEQMIAQGVLLLLAISLTLRERKA